MRVYKIFRSEASIVFCIISFFIILGFFPTLYHWAQTPANTRYSFAFNYYPDYYHYVSWMRDGKDGHIGITTRFTAEVFPRKIVFPYIMYPILGFLGSKFGVDLFLVYTLARVCLGMVYLWSVYWLISLFFANKTKRILALLITCFLPSFIGVSFSGNHVDWRFFLNGVTNFDVYKRFVFIPHHVLSHIFVIISFGLLYSSLKENKKIYALTGGVFVFFGVMTNPAALLYVSIVLAIAFVLYWIVIYKGKISVLLAHAVMFVIPLIATFAYYRLYLFTVYPWDHFSSDPRGAGSMYALTNNMWPFGDYLGALGLGFVLACIAFAYRRFEKNILYLLLLAWAFGPILVFFLCTQFYNYTILEFRLFQTQPYVPLGILASLGIFSLLSSISQRMTRFLIVCVIVAVSLPYYIASFQFQLGEVGPSFYNIYLPFDSIKAFEFLDSQTPIESVVLAGYYTGVLLPAYTHNRMYVGTDDLTYDYKNKIVLFTKFFNNQMTNVEAKAFLKQGTISYILLGPDTPPPDAFVGKLDFVKRIFQSGNSYVYEVIK